MHSEDPRKTYGVSCLYTNQCFTSLGLKCPTTTETCNCPLTSSTIFCDCQRSSNNEYFWNGTSCQQAFTIGTSCFNSSTNYMCQTITQGTICNSTGGSFSCQCSFLNYYNTFTNKCTNQLAINKSCTYTNQCQTAYGLDCINGICTYVHKTSNV